MARNGPEFKHFLHAVHRRLVFVRTLERAGLGALAGCVAGAAFIPLMLWRDQSALGTVAALLVLGGLAGLAWGIARRPSLLATAMEADRQFDLHDLLSTSVTVLTESMNPWSRTVIAFADEACRRHAPSQVVLRRYGSRAWGGIALASALVLTLATLFNPPGNAPAVASGAQEEIPFDAARPEGPQSLVARQVPRQAAPSAGPVDRNHRDPESEGDRHADASESKGETGAPSPAARGVQSGGRDGQGAGVGRAVGTRQNPSRPVPAAPSIPRPPATAPAGARIAGGGAASSAPAAPEGGPDSTGSTAGDASHPPARPPPWQSPAWPADAKAARDAVEAGRVPDDYRDLVRGYFDRP